MSLDRTQRLDRLPSLAPIVAELVNLLAVAEADLEKVAARLERDPALSARLLRIANSPFSGLTRRVGSVREACTYLGTRSLRHLVLTAGVVGQFADSNGGAFDRAAFWQHCAAVGAMSGVIAKRIGEDPESAFTAGLLHDLGRIVLDVHFPGRFLSVLAHRSEHDCLMRDAEEAVLGVDHSVIGGNLAKRWLLPEPIVAGILHHHQPDRAPEARLAGVVHVADVLIRGLEVGNAGDNGIPRLSGPTLERLGLEWHVLADVLVDVEPLLEPARNLILQAAS